MVGGAGSRSRLGVLPKEVKMAVARPESKGVNIAVCRPMQFGDVTNKPRGAALSFVLIVVEQPMTSLFMALL